MTFKVGKDTNPKDAVGIKKPRLYSNLPANVSKEVSVGMMEGARKYGRHNYRVAGVRASVYYDAAIDHLNAYWEGETIDPDSGLHHVTKAIACLYVLRDAQMNDLCEDDRPPKSNVSADRERLQKVVEDIFERYPVSEPAYIAGDKKLR